MSMTLANADIYISRIIGGAGDTAIIAQARDALKGAMEELLHRNNWTYLRQDTSVSFTVGGCDLQAGGVIETTENFNRVAEGMAVAGTDVVAGAKVASFNSNTNLVVSPVNPTPNAGPLTLTFSGNITIVAGTDLYDLPALVWKPMSARLISSQFRPLAYIQPGKYDDISYDQSVQGSVVAYTLYNAKSHDTDNQRGVLRLIRVPSAADVVLVKYYRLPSFDGTDVDVPDEYLYTFLDFARLHLLRSKDAGSRRLPMLTRDIEQRVARAISADREEGGDNQKDMFNTPSEMDTAGVFDGNFWPRGDTYWRQGF